MMDRNSCSWKEWHLRKHNGREEVVKEKIAKKDTQWISLYRVRLEKDRDLMKNRGTFSIAAPEDIVEVIKPVFDGVDREQFVVLYLNMKLQPIGIEIIAIGGSYACNVEIKNVFKGAIVANAVAIAVAHNHPSGVPKPSEGDFTLTRQIAWAGEILGIRLMDHVILGEDVFYSMKKENPGVSLTDIGLSQDEETGE